MKIIVLGASGKIGREIVRAMESDHDVISASRGGEVQVDYTQEACVWRIPTLSHKFLQNPSLVMLALIVTIMAKCVI